MNRNFNKDLRENNFHIPIFFHIPNMKQEHHNIERRISMIHIDTTQTEQWKMKKNMKNEEHMNNVENMQKNEKWKTEISFLW